MIVDKACFERGCACYDDRVDGPGVEVVEKTEKQEPVAWASEGFVSVYLPDEIDFIEKEKLMPLYTSPPAQRTWVGLTAQEIADIAVEVYGSAHHDDISFGTALQAKLKEKNTLPQAREPLTDEQISRIWGSYLSRGLEFARAIEAAHGIKEKNT